MSPSGSFAPSAANRAATAASCRDDADERTRRSGRVRCSLARRRPLCPLSPHCNSVTRTTEYSGRRRRTSSQFSIFLSFSPFLRVPPAVCVPRGCRGNKRKIAGKPPRVTGRAVMRFERQQPKAPDNRAHCARPSRSSRGRHRVSQPGDGANLSQIIQIAPSWSGAAPKWSRRYLETQGTVELINIRILQRGLAFIANRC